ncbi:hypothetical protein [Nonomuraea sp. NPDC002799]
MKTALKRLSTGVAAAAISTAMFAAVTPGTANAEVIVQWYSYTTAGAKACNVAANQAGPEYYCKVLKVAGTKVYALARP